MALKPKQRATAEFIVANPEMSLTEVADKLGISEVTLWRWRQLDEYKEYEHELCQDRFIELEKLAIQKLKENVMKNNQKAIEYALDYRGYKADTKITANIENDITITIE